MRWPAMGLVLALVAAAAGAAQGPGGELTERERAAHVLSRLAYGPRPGDVERVASIGVDAWLDEQLALADDAGVGARLSRYPTVGLSAREVYQESYERTPQDASPEERRRIREKLYQPRNELLRATAMRAVYGEKQVAEVMADFWRNHFNVSYTKGGPAFQLITEWDEEVIRRHALGSFAELLVASAHHPAMLHYLDNAVSRRPPSDQELAELERRVRRATGSREAGASAADLAQQRGLNENYARELLELHTLGVDNGYKQDDVVALAEILTGWTWRGGAEGEWGFHFNAGMHVQGSKRFLQQRIQGEPLQGKEEGDEVLELLAGHKRTAEFIATKLCRQLVRDAPPRKLISAVAATLRKQGGDVVAAIRTLLARPEFWEPETIRAKFKTPQEFVYSAVRVTGARVTDWDELIRRMTSMNQPIYHCDDPTGWYDTAEAWLDPGILAQRWQFAIDLAGDRIDGVRLPADFFADVSNDVPVGEWSDRLVARLLPAGVGVRTQYAFDNAIAQDLLADPDALRVRMLALILGSPEFQRQ